MSNSNFLIFSESFYIKRFKNKGYQYHLDRETEQPHPINTGKSNKDRKDRFIKLLKVNKWTRSELARYLGASRAWVSKVLNN